LLGFKIYTRVLKYRLSKVDLLTLIVWHQCDSAYAY